MAAQNIAAKHSKMSFFMELSPFGWSGKPSLAAVGWVVCLAAESILGHRRLKLERKKAGGFLGVRVRVKGRRARFIDSPARFAAALLSCENARMARGYVIRCRGISLKVPTLTCQGVGT